MKKMILMLSLVLLTFSANAQKFNIKDLEKKWRVDPELMRTVIEKKISERPEMSDLDDLNKAAAVNKALEDLKAYTIEYKSDATYVSVSPKGTKTGNWSYNSETNLLTRLSGTDKPKIFTIISLTITKLHIRSDIGEDLFLTFTD